MAAMVRKLIVEVVEARDLLPKDGTGTSSPYVVIDFDGQRKRTQTILRSLNPTWNEALEFKVNSSSSSSFNTSGDPLEVDVLHDKRVGPSHRNNLLGRVRIDSRHFVRKGEEALVYFPLEKKKFFSWVRGDIGLRIYYVDEPEAPPEHVLPPEAPPEEPMKAQEPPPPPPEEATPAAESTEAPINESPPPPPPPKEEQAPSQEEATQAENKTNNAKIDEQPPPPESSVNTAEAAPPPPPPQPEPEKESTPNRVPHTSIPKRTPEPMERSSYDLVDKMHYLFVQVVRGRSLPNNAKPHVRIEALGRHISTKTARRGAFFEWDQTFAFSREPSALADSSTLKVSLWDMPPGSDVTTAEASNKHYLGGICLDISEVMARDPPDSSLAPQWCCLEGGNGDLMLATWIGTQVDESFHEAVKVDHVKDNRICSHSKVYLSPKLWYLGATIIEANDTLTASREASIFVRASLGFQVQKTHATSTRNGAPSWNEDLIFVTASEPFGEDKLVFSLEIRHGKDTTIIGSSFVDLSSIERRVDDRKVTSRWLDLTPNEEINKRKRSSTRAWGGRLHVRVCLDGGYHVADELPQSASDFRPSARQLWQPPIGVVELGVIGCKNLLPMKAIDGKGSTDSYVVAKYGPKWARTRTVPDSFDPSWNEQYTWTIHDPCTVLTVGVFDESDGPKDSANPPLALGSQENG